MNKYLLDTNVIIDFLKGEKQAFQTLQSIKKDQLFISVITIAEYNYGALRTVKIQKTLDLFTDFSEQANIIVVPIEKPVAEKFAQIQAQLSRKGKLRPVFDLLIASTCLVNDYILVTRNKKDFKGIEGLKIMN